MRFTSASWRRGSNNDFLSDDRIADELVPYVKEIGFTHLELLPISEHPFRDHGAISPSVSSRPLAASARQRISLLRRQVPPAGIGVLRLGAGTFSLRYAWPRALRWHGLYEHEDPRQGSSGLGHAHLQLWPPRGRNFLSANALFWLEQYHVDGLRVDAVASMLYLDYSRKEGEWIPNVHGGGENLEAIDFLRV